MEWGIRASYVRPESGCWLSAQIFRHRPGLCTSVQASISLPPTPSFSNSHFTMRPIPPAAFRCLAQGSRLTPRSFVTTARLSQAKLPRVIDRLIGENGLLMGPNTQHGKSVKQPRPEYHKKKTRETQVKEPRPKDQEKTPLEKGAKGPKLTQQEKHHRKGVSFFERSIRVELPFRSPQNLTHFQLRDMCKCPKCVDPHSKQRSFRTQDIPADIRASNGEYDGKTLRVSWKSDIPGYGEDHVSQWDLDFFEDGVINPRLASTPKLRWDQKHMQKTQHWISYEDYINHDERFATAMRKLYQLGLIFVKDIPQSREMVEKIATRMGPLRNSFYGSTWDVRTVPEAKNVAYTNQFLGFHMDLLYMNEPPGYQLLHCLENSCQGGESLFVDTAQVARMMKTEAPEEYSTLTEHKLAYEYRHEDAIYYKERPVIERAAWIKERLDRVNYSPPFQSALPHYNAHGKQPWEPYQKVAGALKTLSDYMESEGMAFQLKLKPGECVIFDNRRIAHARRQFDTATGSRWLAGAYVDEDAVLSRIAVYTRRFPSASSSMRPLALRGEEPITSEGIHMHPSKVVQQGASEGEAGKQSST